MLHWAAAYRSLSIAELLLEASAEVDAKEKRVSYHSTCIYTFQYACALSFTHTRTHHSPIHSTLVLISFFPILSLFAHLPLLCGGTALMIVVRSGDFAFAKLLVEAGTEVDAEDDVRSFKEIKETFARYIVGQRCTHC